MSETGVANMQCGITILVHSSSLVCAVVWSFFDSVDMPMILWLLKECHCKYICIKMCVNIYLPERQGTGV